MTRAAAHPISVGCNERRRRPYARRERPAKTEQSGDGYRDFAVAMVEQAMREARLSNGAGTNARRWLAGEASGALSFARLAEGLGFDVAAARERLVPIVDPSSGTPG